MALIIKHPSQRGGRRLDDGSPDNQELAKVIDPSAEETFTVIPKWRKDLDVALVFTVGFAYVAALMAFIVFKLLALHL